MSKKPTNVKDYKTWLIKEQHLKICSKTENHFNLVALKVRESFQTSSYWRSVLKSMRDYNEEYLLKTGYALFVEPEQAPSIHAKSFDSFLLKTFRLNVLNNDKWPEPPSGGWILPENWLPRANDIVRTCFVVKYLDGVEFLLQKLISKAKDNNISCYKYYVAGTDGYYAAHAYISNTYEVPRLNFDTEQKEITVEIQITSQLQEVIRKLLHQHFEIRRKSISQDTDWQWNYKSDEFATNYLGHILHYVEGMIMEVRDRSETNKIGGKNE